MNVTYENAEKTMVSVVDNGMAYSGVKVNGDGYPSQLVKEWMAAGNTPSLFVVPQARPVMIQLAMLQARIEAESAWDTYVTYMFGTPTRRNAFLKIMFIGQPLDIANAAFRTTLLGAGLTQAQVDRILAAP